MITKNKLLLSVIFCLILQTSAFAGAGIFLKAIKEGTLEIILQSKHFASDEVADATTNFTTAINGLMNKMPDNNQEALAFLNNLKVQDNQKEMLKDAKKLFSSDISKMSGKDLIRSLDSLNSLSASYGKFFNASQICGTCANPRSVFTSHFSPVHPQFSYMAKISHKINAMNNTQRVNFLKKEIKKIGGNVDDIDDLASEDYRTLMNFFFLNRQESGASKEMRKMIQQIIKLSRQSDGTVNLIGNKEGSQTFYKLVAEDFNKTDRLNQWNYIFSKMIKLKKKSNKSNKELFFDVLSKKAGKSKKKQQAIKELKQKNCYFKL